MTSTRYLLVACIALITCSLATARPIQVSTNIRESAASHNPRNAVAYFIPRNTISNAGRKVRREPKCLPKLGKPQKDMKVHEPGMSDRSFILKKEMGEGGFATVWRANSIDSQGIENPTSVVLKIQSFNEHTTLIREHEFYEALRTRLKNHHSLNGKFPFPYASPPFIWDCREVLPMQQLGLTVWDHVERAHKKGQNLQMGEILKVARQMIAILKFMHGTLRTNTPAAGKPLLKMVHHDLKPENMLYGLETARRHEDLHLIDFGLARWIEPGYPKKDKSYQGTPLYMTIGTLSGLTPTQGGELEQLGYVLLEIVCGDGNLPWGQEHGKAEKIALREKSFKRTLTKTELCQHDPHAGATATVPDQLFHFMQHAWEISSKDTNHIDPTSYIALEKLFHVQ